jgi:hypothetical protein
MTEIWDAPENDEPVNSEIHYEAVIERPWRGTLRWYSSVFVDTLGGRGWVNLEMHSEIVIERVTRYTVRPWMSEHEGCNGTSFNIPMEAVIKKVWRNTVTP